MKKHISFLLASVAILLGGSAYAQTITGSGTAGYLTKFNGATTITNAPGFFNSGTNYGIGTTTPGAKLHMVVTVANDGLRVQGSANPCAVGLFNSATGGHNWSLVSTGTNSTEGIGHFMIYDQTAAASRLFINGTNGNVGIGTTAPAAGLNVHNGALYLSGAVAGYGGPQLFFSNTQSQVEWAEEYTTAATQSGLNFWRPFGATGTPGNYMLFLANNGKVGVNTDNPTAQLTVNGKTLIGDPAAVNINTTSPYGLYVQNGILTSKIRAAVVNSTYWADYVFADNYKLRSLTEVEKFVKTNKHLPEVPSAAEVERDGVDMATMDATLLKKVEELTLYMIDQNKKIEAQQQEIEALKKQVAEKH